MRLAKPAFAISWLLIAIGVGWGIHRGKSVFGPDFLGGDTTTFEFQQRAPEATLRSALAKAGVADPTIQYQKDTDPFAGQRETLRVASPEKTGAVVAQTLEQSPVAQLHAIGKDHIGATVGEEIPN